MPMAFADFICVTRVKKKKKKKTAAVKDNQGPKPRGTTIFRAGPPPGGTPPFVPFYEGKLPAGGKLGHNLFPGGKLLSPPQFPPQQTNPEDNKRGKAGGGPKEGEKNHIKIWVLAPPPAPLFPPREKTRPLAPPLDFLMKNRPHHPPRGGERGGGFCGYFWGGGPLFFPPSFLPPPPPPLFL
eukprot:FR742110.1.p2 GENE.FR742110.1~~FR742110.1.p2  ORF type:complete len:182 (+),score=113.00 FR742110.1:702-1247(+)